MRKAFTLIEVIIVIAIIGVLASLILSGLLGSQREVSEKVTRVELNNLALALQVFMEEGGDFPSGEDFGPKTQEEFDSGEFEFEDEGNSKFFSLFTEDNIETGKLFKLNKERWVASELDPDRKVLLDAYRRPYIYKCPGEIYKYGCDIYSRGPNGLDDGGKEDDIIMEFPE